MPWKIFFGFSVVPPPSLVLQFGHGGDAVENNDKAGLQRRDEMAFNSATAVMPWKMRSAPAHYGHRHNLQFGHGSDAVENGIRSRVLPAVCGTFNSATAMTPWKTQWRSTSPTRPSRLTPSAGGDDATVENLLVQSSPAGMFYAPALNSATANGAAVENRTQAKRTSDPPANALQTRRPAATPWKIAKSGFIDDAIVLDRRTIRFGGTVRRRRELRHLLPAELATGDEHQFGHSEDDAVEN